ncbi:hypothetical protein GQ44DRAFT_824929 [Phaeosphaeriaceae sp. PMI808]|nr:hypothetical protein GQ44DRAFT_824929 [Phaeosphaeriaceae sp. PMI808]
MSLMKVLRDVFTISKEHSRATAARTKWFKTTSIDDIYDQFLGTAISPCIERHCVPPNLLTPSAVSSFDATVCTFRQTPNGEIEPSEVFRFLRHAHPSQALLIQSTQPSLMSLLYAHARFPFSNPVPLTRDALLRVVMLLTQRGTDFFEKRIIEPPKRTDGDRLTYIFKVLATPNAGIGIIEYEDIEEVLLRLPFPPPLPTFNP